MQLDHLADFDGFDYSKLVDIQLELIDQLPDDLKALALRAEPGSTRMHPLPNGWFGLTIGHAEPVALGSFHRDALRADNEPGSVN